MKLLSTVQDLCAIDTTTGIMNANRIMQVCLSNISSVSSSKIIQSASDGAAGDLIFQRRGLGKSKILLLGHYDTVPLKKKSQKLSGDLLFAPGSYDMKGGVALALGIFDYIEERDFSEVTLYLAGDEEWRKQPLRIDGKWDAVLAFEGGEERGLVSSRFGAGVLECYVEGEALRATYPPQGESSIQALASLLLELEKKNTALVHFTSSQLFSGSAINVIPAQSSASGILRYQDYPSRQKFLQSAPQDIRGLSIDYQLRELIPPLQEKPKVQEMLKVLRIRGTLRVGSSDISWLDGQSPILLDGFGPIGGGEHSDSEYIVVSSLEKQLSLAKRVINYLVNDY